MSQTQRTLFILLSHPLTETQREDARKHWGVTRFLEVPSRWWGQIPADAESVLPYLEEIVRFLEREASEGDLLLAQGDFGATVAIVHWARERGLLPLYATTRRVARERSDGERIITTREFRHVRFRPYEFEIDFPNEGA